MGNGASLTAQQQAYLATMGIPIWLEQSATAVSAPLQLQHLGWDELRAQAQDCAACGLHQHRQTVVFGEGNPQADLVIICDVPDPSHVKPAPINGPASELMTAMLRSIGIERQGVYLTNLVKCHPPQGRRPSQAEMDCCRAYLLRQIELLAPRLILAAGESIGQHLLQIDASLSEMRNAVKTMPGVEVAVVVTAAPADLLASPLLKRQAWQDLLLAKNVLDSATG